MDGAVEQTPAEGLEGIRFAVVDVETTGLKMSRHHILQVAVVTVDASGTVLDEWSSYVRPRRWPLARLGSRRVHGITRRVVRRAPPGAPVLRELVRRIEGHVLTAHHVAFDMGFLRRHGRRLGVPLGEHDELCTLALSRSLDPEAELSHRLADVCVRYGVSNDRPHDALHDARAVGAVLPYLLKEAGITTREQLKQAGELSRRRRPVPAAAAPPPSPQP